MHSSGTALLITKPGLECVAKSCSLLSFHDFFFLIARFNLVDLFRITYLDPYSTENQLCNFTSLVYAQNYGKIYLRCFLASKFLVKLLKVTGIRKSEQNFANALLGKRTDQAMTGRCGQILFIFHLDK